MSVDHEPDRTPRGAAPDAVASIMDAALRWVRGPNGVRVEDYLTALAAATGEAALADGGSFDIEDNDLVPGAAVFGDRINEVLTGDGADLTDAPPTSVVGLLRDRLVPDTVPAEAFGSLEDLYRLVAANVGDTAWGEVALTVPEANRPRVMPLRAAFVLRSAVDAALAAAGAGGPSARSPDAVRSDRHVPCTLALAAAIEQTKLAIDVRVALRLSLEVVFGMAKTVPMSKRAFAAADDSPAQTFVSPTDPNAHGHRT